MHKNLKSVTKPSTMTSKSPKKATREPNKAKSLDGMSKDKGDCQKVVVSQHLKSPRGKKHPQDGSFLVLRKSEVRCHHKECQTGAPYEGEITNRRSLQSLIPRLIPSTSANSVKQTDSTKEAINILDKIFNQKAREDHAMDFGQELSDDQKVHLLEQAYAQKYNKNGESTQVLLPEPERRHTLNMLEKKYANCIEQLNFLPLNSHSADILRNKKELEQQIEHYRKGLEIFRKPKVYVTLDSK